jgi:hypothetical protein
MKIRAISIATLVLALGIAAPGRAEVLNEANSYLDNPVRRENQQPGSADWQLTNPTMDGEIQGYASLTSVNRGGSNCQMLWIARA